VNIRDAILRALAGPEDPDDKDLALYRNQRNAICDVVGEWLHEMGDSKYKAGLVHEANGLYDAGNEIDPP
jgi:hypothetical protein